MGAKPSSSASTAQKRWKQSIRLKRPAGVCAGAPGSLHLGGMRMSRSASGKASLQRSASAWKARRRASRSRACSPRRAGARLSVSLSLAPRALCSRARPHFPRAKTQDTHASVFKTLAICFWDSSLFADRSRSPALTCSSSSPTEAHWRFHWSSVEPSVMPVRTKRPSLSLSSFHSNPHLEEPISPSRSSLTWNLASSGTTSGTAAPAAAVPAPPADALASCRASATAPAADDGVEGAALLLELLAPPLSSLRAKTRDTLCSVFSAFRIGSKDLSPLAQRRRSPGETTRDSSPAALHLWFHSQTGEPSEMARTTREPFCSS
mmetsp:Transcript_72389/g.204601  ORF Transcript_72389/g.204601 Transcript_72389/m.204601 type:complete len:321 (-) Transcript_72389:673-1635(-)